MNKGHKIKGGKFMSKRLLLLVMVTLLSMFVAVGCGSDGSDGKDGANPDVGGIVDDVIDTIDDDTSASNDYAGANACITCHNGKTLEEHIASKHVTHSTHVSSADVGDGCTACHDPLNEGIWFEGYLDSADIPAGGLAAVSCEACHGKASNHISAPGKYKPEFSKPGTEQCGTCHATLPDSHIPHHPYADMITERFESGGHSGSARSGSCSACHSNEGFVARNTGVRAIAKNKGDLADTFVAPELDEFSQKTCSTCHDDHTFELRATDTVETFDNGGTDVEKVVFSQQFNLCTACHMVSLEYTGVAYPNAHGYDDYMIEYELAAGYDDVTANGDDLDYHASRSTRTIADTHFAGSFNGVAVEGYSVNPGSATACSDCHDVHSANKVVGAEEAEAIEFATGFGKTHGNYLAQPFNYRTSGTCAPCHFGSEVVSMTLGNEPDTTTARPFHALGCVTCHDPVNTTESFDITARRTFPADHVFEFQSGATVTAAELGNAQICFECHKGREGVKADAGTTTQVYGINYIHYAPVFATLFGGKSEMHVTYGTNTYAEQFEHLTISADFGGKLDCTSCHEVHTAEAIITKTGTTCVSCHSSGGLYDTDVLEARVEMYADRLFDTIYALTPVGLYTALGDYDNDSDTPDTPRFADGKTEANLVTILTGRTTASEIGSNQLAKAGSVWKNFMYEEPAAWAHNSKFARQLMYDAIDDLGGDLTGLTRPN
ncbi:MAG TPA: hypothetical protein DCM31_09720 [Deferribacteraceae bacterium]|nr:hypothetical protein [Deferribacteraceae bacterium]